MFIKTPTSHYFLLLPIVLLLSCDGNEEVVAPDPTPLQIPFTELDGDQSDIDIQPAFAWDTYVYGNFTYDENYFYRSDLGFDFNSNWFKAWYQGINIHNCKVNNVTMCSTDNNCYQEADGNFVANAEWQKDGTLTTGEKFTWDFINLKKENGYRIAMKQLPRQVELTSVPASLSTINENVIYFNKASEEDSVLFELVIVPKENLEKTTILGLICTQRHFAVKPQPGRFTIPGEMIRASEITPKDSVFMNIVAIKRIIKVIDGNTMGLTYRVNNIHPVLIE